VGLTPAISKKKQLARGINNQPGGIMALLQSMRHRRKLLKNNKSS